MVLDIFISLFEIYSSSESWDWLWNVFLVFRHVLEFHKLPNDGCQAPHKDKRKVAVIKQRSPDEIRV